MSKQHYERFNLYINFQTKSGHLTDPVREAIDLFEHTLDKTALVWFQMNRSKFKDLTTLKTMSLQRYNPWGKTKREQLQSWNILSFNPKTTDVDEHIDLINTLGDMVDQKEEAKKEMFIETMPTMIQTHLITCKDWATVKDTAKSLEHIILKCDLPTPAMPMMATGATVLGLYSHIAQSADKDEGEIPQLFKGTKPKQTRSRGKPKGKPQEQRQNPPKAQEADETYTYENPNNYYHNAPSQSRGCRSYNGQGSNQQFRGFIQQTEAKDLSIVNISFKVIATREAHLNKTVLNMAIIINPIFREIKEIAIEAKARAMDLSNSEDAHIQYHDFDNQDSLTFRDKYTTLLQQELQNPYWNLHDPIVTKSYQIFQDMDIETMPHAMYFTGNSDAVTKINQVPYQTIEYNDNGMFTAKLMNDTPIEIFIDNGATPSILPLHTYNKFPLLHTYPKTESNTPIHTEGGLITSHFWLELSLKLQHQTIQIKALVCDSECRYNLILGQTSMAQLSAWQDYAAHKLYLQQISIPLIVRNNIRILPGKTGVISLTLRPNKTSFTPRHTIIGKGIVYVKPSDQNLPLRPIEIEFENNHCCTEIHNTSDSTVEFLHGQEMAYFDVRSKGLVQINSSKHFPIDQYLHDRMTHATLSLSPLAYKKLIHPTEMPCITTHTEMPIDDTNKSTPDDKYPWLDPDDIRRNMTDTEILQMKLNLKDSVLDEKVKKNS